MPLAHLTSVMLDGEVLLVLKCWFSIWGQTPARVGDTETFDGTTWTEVNNLITNGTTVGGGTKMLQLLLVVGIEVYMYRDMGWYELDRSK